MTQTKSIDTDIFFISDDRLKGFSREKEQLEDEVNQLTWRL